MQKCLNKQYAHELLITKKGLMNFLKEKVESKLLRIRKRIETAVSKEEYFKAFLLNISFNLLLSVRAKTPTSLPAFYNKHRFNSLGTPTNSLIEYSKGNIKVPFEPIPQLYSLEISQVSGSPINIADKDIIEDCCLWDLRL